MDGDNASNSKSAISAALTACPTPFYVVSLGHHLPQTPATLQENMCHLMKIVFDSLPIHTRKHIPRATGISF